jgi:hypothetical protein
LQSAGNQTHFGAALGADEVRFVPARPQLLGNCKQRDHMSACSTTGHKDAQFIRHGSTLADKTGSLTVAAQ